MQHLGALLASAANRREHELGAAAAFLASGMSSSDRAIDRAASRLLAQLALADREHDEAKAAPVVKIVAQREPRECPLVQVVIRGRRESIPSERAASERTASDRAALEQPASVRR